jgi:hypothetical protein
MLVSHPGFPDGHEPAPELDPPKYLTSTKVVEALSFLCVDNARKGGYMTVISNVVFME